MKPESFEQMWNSVIECSAEQAVEHLELEMERRNLLPMTDDMRELIVIHTQAVMFSVLNAPQRALNTHGDA